jgi:hypothetical protein
VLQREGYVANTDFSFNNVEATLVGSSCVGTGSCISIRILEILRCRVEFLRWRAEFLIECTQRVPSVVTLPTQNFFFLMCIPIRNTPIILGLPWLKLHNPTIDWYAYRLSFHSDKYAEYCLTASPQAITVAEE